MDTYNKSKWMDWLRGYAVLMIIFHHWIMFFYSRTDIVILDKLFDFLYTISGNSIHIFFIISGAGLTVSFYSKNVRWSDWYLKRFKKIIIPFWITVVVFYAIINCCHFIFPTFIKNGFTIRVLLAYLTFTRNFYTPAIDFNLSLWFVPNIVGLYCVFPAMITFFTKINRFGFLLSALCVSFLSIVSFMLFGLSVNNQHSIFLFFVFEFAFGMYIGYLSLHSSIVQNKKNVIFLLLLGVLFYGISYFMVEKTSWGGNFNKPFTSLGLFFVTYPLFFGVQRILPILFDFFKNISRASYYMYLLHFPIVFYFLQPFKGCFPENTFLHLVLFIGTYMIFCRLIYRASRSIILRTPFLQA
jgi:peptidoglycan/LPS O-acetylase OafA/YrhL